MATFEATITSKGQVTLPAKLRASLGLKAGDKLVFHQDRQGEIRIEAVTETLASLGGVVKAQPGSVDGERIARWIEESRGGAWQIRRTHP